MVVQSASVSDTKEIIWSPPDWDCNCFPLPNADQEVLEMEWVISRLQAHIDTCTDWDTTALGRALHVGHMLTVMQNDEGEWPSQFNARTGEWIGAERTKCPIPMFQRMNDMLRSTEFDHVIRRAGFTVE